MTAARSIPTPSGPRPHRPRLHVRPAHRLPAERVRRRAGAAWARLQASGQAMAAALQVHHSQVARRKQGQGGFANSLVEIAALEAVGIDTTPLLEAMLETQLDARQTRAGGGVSARELARIEQPIDGEEDCAEQDYLAGIPGAARRWRERLIALQAVGAQILHALRQEEAAEGRSA